MRYLRRCTCGSKNDFMHLYNIPFVCHVHFTCSLTMMSDDGEV